jgi:hypothetical protein
MRRLFDLALVLLVLASAACAGVLGIRPRPAWRAFEHRVHVLKGTSCLECHAGITAAARDGPLHLPTTATCLRCHEKPHDPHPCEGCHSSPDARERAQIARRHLKFEHRTHVQASSGQCVRCHVGIGDARPEQLRPPMAACFGCHHHEDQWRVRDCDGCHVDLPAERITPESHVVHDGDFVREHGVRAASARDLCSTCHSEQSCSACHGVTTPGLPARLAFDRPTLSGLHRAGFRSRHAEEARGQPGLCLTCHSDESCRDCHTRFDVAPGTAGASPHPRGWLLAGRGGGDHGRSARVDPGGCASCHGGAGEQLCIGCHRVGGPGGNPHGPGFKSNRDMRREQPCRSCHTP